LTDNRCRIDDFVAGFGVEQLEHEAGQMPWGTELAVFAGSGDFAEQVFEGTRQLTRFLSATACS